VQVQRQGIGERDLMLARMLVPMRAMGEMAHLEWHPPGTLVDGSNALLFVQLGACEPADAECEQAHGMTPEQLAEAQVAYRATCAGIWPEDLDKFKAGEILGYDMEGQFIPGPNWTEPEDEQEEDDDE
jgi:hypothetical protein